MSVRSCFYVNNAIKQTMTLEPGHFPHYMKANQRECNQAEKWTSVVVVKQHQAPRSYIEATPDGTQIRQNWVHLQLTEEKSPPAMGPAWELTNDEPSLPMEMKLMVQNHSQHFTSWPTRQKKPKDSKATSASHWNCIDIVNLVLVLRPLNQT